MDGLGRKILDALKMYKNEFNRKVLKTCEEVEANTSDKYLVAAPVVGELINKLSGCSLEQEGNDFYITGADSVRKKLGNMELVYTYTTTSPVISGTNKISINRNVSLNANAEYILFCVLVAAGTAGSRGNLLYNKTAVNVTSGTATIEKLSPGWFIWKIKTSTECTININGTITGSDGGAGSTFGVCSIDVFG